MSGDTRTTVRLVKAQALGNDFLLHAVDRLPGAEAAPLARRLCDRHRGVGGDGLMCVEATGAGARTRLFNADGGIAEVSGNGVRCVAAWLARQRGLVPGGSLTIETDAGARPLTLVARDAGRWTFRAAMGVPRDLREVDLDVEGRPVRVVTLDMGNPQCVVLGPATDARLHGLAGAIARHPHFPAGTNVELVDVRTADRLEILIWERGVGPTEASGTGACASAVAAARFGGASRVADVASPGGVQRVEWTDEGVWLTGWAELVAAVEAWLPDTREQGA
ncbi:MAG: diaminopimelate epimerase [Vicinamibacterales bacterium]